MRRRDFIILVGGATAWPLAARAQQLRRVGALIHSAADDAIFQPRVAAFQRSLRSLGWIEGKNLQLDIRWDELDLETAQRHAAELAALAPDVILTSGTAGLAAMQRATRTIPIVFRQVSDPVAQGFVTSIAHPGGNITGSSVCLAVKLVGESYAGKPHVRAYRERHGRHRECEPEEGDRA
jgi:putative tryptophan/tyrosine transport system substrate-binding protein